MGKAEQGGDASKGLLNKAGNYAVRFVGGGVGFLAEYKEHRRTRAQAMAEPAQYIHGSLGQGSGGTTTTRPTIATVDDEAAWAMDDAIEYELSEKYESEGNAIPQRMSVQERSAMGQGDAWKPLPCPVILPQRRPRDKSRGFVRAYAPVLNNCGIDQETFLQFLKNFQKSTKQNAIFPVLMVGGQLVGSVPHPAFMAASIVMCTTATVGKTIDVRKKTNDFLNRSNEEMFKPAGLFVMIMKYLPESESRDGKTNDIQLQEMDVSNNVKTGESKKFNIGSVFPSLGERLKTASGESGTVPEAAPLIFPEVDYTLKHDGSMTFKDKIRDFNKVLGDFNDRRAQIRYGAADPNSGLVLPEEKNKLRTALAHPDHPIINNGFLGLVSGGHIIKEKKNNVAGNEDGLSRETSSELSKSKSGSSGKFAKVSKLLHKDVLYLMIANLPSAEQLQEAQANLDKATRMG